MDTPFFSPNNYLEKQLKYILNNPKASFSDTEFLEAIFAFYCPPCEPSRIINLCKPFCFLTEEATQRFQIGYSSQKIFPHLKKHDSWHEVFTRLSKLNFFYYDTKERFHNCILVPIFNSQGHITQIYGWNLNRNLPPDFPRDISLNLSDRDPWNYAGLLHQKQWIFCQNVWDALTWWSAGFHNVSCGSEGFELCHFALLDQVRPQKVILCSNNNAVGNYFADECLTILKEKNIAAARIKFQKKEGLRHILLQYPRGEGLSSTLVDYLEKASSCF